jgi:hypothetical protein
MIEINTAVFNAIKAGSIPTIRFFSDNMKFLPAPPYAVIKQEAGDGQVRFRIFAHFEPGNQDKLDRYIRYELSELMREPRGLTGKPRFKSDGQWTDTVATNDDGTISASRVFFCPVIIT